MERRVQWKLHARCEAGEKSEIISETYLSLFYKVVVHFNTELSNTFERIFVKTFWFNPVMTAGNGLIVFLRIHSKPASSSPVYETIPGPKAKYSTVSSFSCNELSAS